MILKILGHFVGTLVAVGLGFIGLVLYLVMFLTDRDLFDSEMRHQDKRGW